MALLLRPNCLYRITEMVMMATKGKPSLNDSEGTHSHGDRLV